MDVDVSGDAEALGWLEAVRVVLTLSDMAATSLVQL
jgi:hypothetical protein